MRDTNSSFNNSMFVYPSKLHLFSLAPLLTASFHVCNMRNIHSSLNGSIGTSILAASSQVSALLHGCDTNSSFLCSALICTSLTTAPLLCCAPCETEPPPPLGYIHQSCTVILSLHSCLDARDFFWQLTFPCPCIFLLQGGISVY